MVSSYDCYEVQCIHEIKDLLLSNVAYKFKILMSIVHSAKKSS
jgi:hypothetical protein